MSPFHLILVLAAQAGAFGGEITSVSPDSGIVHVNLGELSGFARGDGLRILDAGSEDNFIASAIVVEVLAGHLVARVTHSEGPIRKGARVLPGRAAYSGPTPPYITGNVSLSPGNAFWGRVTTVDLDIVDLDGDLLRVECTVDGGILLDGISTGSRFHWLPPVMEGTMRLNVRAIDREGLESTRSLPLKARGIPVRSRPTGFTLDADFGPRFLHATDIAFDPAGALHVLDGKLRRIVALAPSGEPRWISGPFGPDVEFTRLLVRDGHAFLLDVLGRRVVRYDLGKRMFDGKPRIAAGSRRHGSGALGDPVDATILPDGETWVLDARSGTILRYGKDGHYRSSFGRFVDPVALRRDPVGTVHVLDLGLHEIHSFRNDALVHKKPVPVDPGPVDFDSLDLLYGNRLGQTPLEDARALRRDHRGRVHVLHQGGRSIVRLGAEGSPRQSLGGSSLAGALRVRAGRDGGFSVEDNVTRWSFGSDGWLVGVSAPRVTDRTSRDAAGTPYSLDSGKLSCGGRPIHLEGFAAIDFDVDPYGRVLLLEEHTGRVVRLRASSWK